MKKGICIGCLPGTLSDEEKLRLAKEAGYDGVEVNTFEDLRAAEQFAETARRIGVELPSVMASGHWKFPLSSADEETRQQGLANIRLSVDAAVVCGGTTVLVVPGVVNEKQLYADAYRIALQSMQEMAAYAGERGIKLAVENVWNRFLLSPMEMQQFVQEIASPHVGVYFDTGNILIYGYPQSWIRELGSMILKVHVKDFDVSSRQFKHLLQGSVNWVEVRAALLEIGYDDYLTAELPLYPAYPDQMVRDTSVHIDRIMRGE
jgi:hexulose-6-phosphate isomerase